MSDEIKDKFADALVECMKTTSLDKISVTNICKEANISRQTFYRNFLDKYDLMNWHFDKLLIKSFAEMGYEKTIKEGLIRKFHFITNDRIFFEVAFRNDEYHNLKDYDFQMIFQFYKNLIEEKSHKPCDPSLLPVLEMYCEASIYMTVKWVLGGMQMKEEELAQIMIDAIPYPLVKFFDEINLEVE